VTILIVPGLNDSGPGHWQSWFETQLPDTVRVNQPDWGLPNLDAWAANVTAAIDASPTPPIVIAHSFGVLATVRARPRAGKRIAAAMLVAPADPDVFGYARLMPRLPLPYPSVLVASQTDPWLSFGNAAIWAGHWASRFIDHGNVAHINVDSGHGPWPDGLAIFRELELATRRSLARVG
jgi:uncharacterized protein